MTTALAVLLLFPAGAGAATCGTPWSSSAVYTGGAAVSYGGHNWTAKWWTQNEPPSTGGSGVWSDQGACGGSGDPSPTPTPTQPGPGGFPVSQAQFEQMFPNRNPFYTYQGLLDALPAYPGFTTTGSDTVRRQEAAAFLANVSHETGGLVYVVEQNTANYPHYCDASQPYGCPAGQAAYYGRGPIQLSWNFNYKAAGDSLGIDLLDSPGLVETDPAVAWKTGLWYWNTQNGPGTMTAHDAMVNGAGFGETIRSINGTLECNGNNPAQMQHRVSLYQGFAQLLGVDPGANLTC
ncbi:glycoside hydrolase family 19 protein [Kitasatospora sp. NPDC059722]|uniref:glycoside hydrolase family 19 protein n=1 Tax=Kitasatospora sp. NPDC059722 TaxID=3346925 RepID=UPI0036CBFF6B